MSNQSPEFVMTRTFNVPRERMWQAWTDLEQANKWFGPKGCTVTYTSFDLRPGGAACYCVSFNGQNMWGRWGYQELKAPEKLVAVVSFTDESGKKIVPHPGMPNWPLEILSTISFADRGDKTEVQVDWRPYNASPSEVKAFAENTAGMEQGWGGSLEQLGAFLSEKARAA